MFRLTFDGRRRARAHRGGQEEASRRVAAHARRRSTQSSRISAPTRSASRRASSVRSSRRERRQLHPLLRDQRAIAGHRPRARERDPLAREALPVRALDRPLATRRSSRLAAAIDEDLTRALALRERGKGRRRRLPHPRPLRRALPAAATTPSGASTSRSTRSPTARLPDRREGASRTGGCRGCCASAASHNVRRETASLSRRRTLVISRVDGPQRHSDERCDTPIARAVRASRRGA